MWGVRRPAVQAAVEAPLPPAAPEVIIPDSAPVSSASLRPAARCSSTMLTKWCEASVWAARTSGNCSDPLKYVQVPAIDYSLDAEPAIYVVPRGKPHRGERLCV